MSTEHTPGPWQRDGKGRTISSAKGPICECFSGPVGIDECDANERLIAAAPDLLEALQSMEMALIGYLHQNDITQAALSKARAAIDKATGVQA